MGLAVMTGASSGVRLELAERFADHGYDPVVAAEDDGIPASTSGQLGQGRPAVTYSQPGWR